MSHLPQKLFWRFWFTVVVPDSRFFFCKIGPKIIWGRLCTSDQNIALNFFVEILTHCDIFFLLFQICPVKLAHKTWGCPICSKIMDHKGNMERHVLTHTDIKRFNCTDCVSSFRSKGELKRHLLRIHHRNPDDDFWLIIFWRKKIAKYCISSRQ